MLAISYGTRPELIKLQPVMDELSKRNIQFRSYQVCQHQLAMVADVHIPVTDHAGNRLNQIIRSCLKSSFFDITALLIQGDTASAYGMALNAFHRGIPIIHLEAGMRTYQCDPYPEEFYRRSISLMASLHLCSTEYDYDNLECEINNRIKVIGSTAIDALLKIYPSIPQSLTINNRVVMTIHRRENWDKLNQWLENLNSTKMDCFFIKHPNPELTIKEEDHPFIRFLPSQPHERMIKIIAEASVVVTDSGGIQEEACYLGVPTVICREHTERHNPVVMCNNPEDLRNSIERASNISQKVKDNYDYFGTGGSAILAVDEIEKFLLTIPKSVL